MKAERAGAIPPSATTPTRPSLIDNLSSTKRAVVLNALSVINDLISTGKKYINDEVLFDKLVSLASTRERKTSNTSTQVAALDLLTRHLDKIDKSLFQTLENVALDNVSNDEEFSYTIAEESIKLLDALFDIGFIPKGNETVLGVLVNLANDEPDPDIDKQRNALISKLTSNKES